MLESESRIVMKAWVWLIVASVGFAVMLWAYLAGEQIDDKAPWA